MAIPWELIEQNVKAYIQTDEYHSQEMVNIKLVDEIVNAVNTSGATVFNNPISISKLPLLASLMSSQNTIADIQTKFFDTNIDTNIDIQSIIGNAISDNMPNMDEINAIKKTIEDGISFYTDKLEEFKNDGISATSEIYKKFENELNAVQDKLTAILNGDYSSLINTEQYTDQIKIPITTSLGKIINIAIPDIPNYESLIEDVNTFVNELMQFKLTLSLPNIDILSMLTDLLPEIDLISPIRKLYEDEISFYTDKLEEFKRYGISETSEIYKKFHKELENAQNKLVSEIEYVQNFITEISNINFPDVNEIYNKILKAGNDILASTAKIIPISSAIPGGVPISEQVTYPGMGEPFEFGIDSGKDFVKAYIDMIRTQLANASITNVSSYNNVITPISSVGIV
jgi:prefoldin subunit 5